MSEQNLSYISRGASLLVVLGVLVSGALAYAQSAAEAKISVSASNGKTSVVGIQIQQIFTGTGKVKEYCVTDTNGLCTFVVSEKDGDVHFIGAELDKKTGKAGELYGHEIEPNYGCRQVTFRLNPKTGKIYQYVDGAQKDSADRYAIFAESFFQQKCVANAKGGYDWVNKDTGMPVTSSSAVTPISTVSLSPTAPKESPEKKSPSESKKPEMSKEVTPSGIGDEFVDAEDNQDAANDDVILQDAGLARARFVKKTKGALKASGYGLLFRLITKTDASQTILSGAHIQCSFSEGDGGSVMPWQFKQPPGALKQEVFYEMEKSEWEVAKKKQPFGCAVVLDPDSDETNNSIRLQFHWKGGKLSVNTLEHY